MNKDDQFSKDIKSLLGPVVMDMDKNMIATQQSQQDLGQEIDRLIAGRKGWEKHGVTNFLFFFLLNAPTRTQCV